MMNRFVLLHHEVPVDFVRPSHFDLMFGFEDQPMLLAWAIEEKPAAGRPIDAMRLPDHRIDYLDYEGPISENRGIVRRVDWGEFNVHYRSSSKLDVSVGGQLLQGNVLLVQVNLEQWRLSYRCRP